MTKKILITLGGNALLKPKQKVTIEQYMKTVKQTCKQIIKIIENGYQVVISHGNGSQVGFLALQNEIAKKEIPQMPLDVCGAETQSQIGYLLQQQLRNELADRKIKRDVVTIVTQVLVDKRDPSFKKPTKPIGPFYAKKPQRRWKFIKTKHGYRRVVPSPMPLKIIEEKVIKSLVEQNNILIACGGGGIPVIMKGRKLRGIEAVIDKDLTAALLANLIKAHLILDLTDVDCVYLNYGTDEQKKLKSIQVREIKKYLKEGQFPPGSMGPKIQAAINFIKSNPNGKVIITSVNKSKLALKGRAGTIITK